MSDFGQQLHTVNLLIAKTIEQISSLKTNRASLVAQVRASQADYEYLLGQRDEATNMKELVAQTLLQNQTRLQNEQKANQASENIFTQALEDERQAKEFFYEKTAAFDQYNIKLQQLNAKTKELKEQLQIAEQVGTPKDNLQVQLELNTGKIQRVLGPRKAAKEEMYEAHLALNDASNAVEKLKDERKSSEQEQLQKEINKNEADLTLMRGKIQAIGFDLLDVTVERDNVIDQIKEVERKIKTHGKVLKKLNFEKTVLESSIDDLFKYKSFEEPIISKETQAELNEASDVYQEPTPRGEVYQLPDEDVSEILDGVVIDQNKDEYAIDNTLSVRVRPLVEQPLTPGTTGNRNLIREEISQQEKA